MMEMLISFPGGKRVDATFDGFVVKTDQPPQGGGDGSAPTPFSLFLASMATCAGIYVLGFCQQRGLPTEGITLRQSVDSDPATHMVTQVNLTIALPSDFPAKYTEALVRAAQLCAVKKHLENPPVIHVSAHLS